MLDVYRHPTIEALAAKFEPHPGTCPGNPGARSAPVSGAATYNGDELAQLAEAVDEPQVAVAEDGHAPKSVPFHPTPFWRHFWCGAAQLVSLVFILSFFALQWLAPYLTYTILIEEDYGYAQAILGAFASLVLFYPVMVLVPIAVKWLVIGRYRPGAYPVWGSYYFRFWLATTIETAVPVGYLAGTPLLNIYLRLMGAKVGRNVHLNSDSFAIYDLLSIGDDTTVNNDSNLLGYTVEDGLLKLGSVAIGRCCFVGTRAAVGLNAVMQDEAALEDLSLLPSGTTISQGQTWRGSPARPEVVAPSSGSADFQSAVSPISNRQREYGSNAPPLSPHLGPLPDGNVVQVPANLVRPTALRCFAFGILHAIGLLIFPVLVVAPLFPGIVLMNNLNYLDPYYWYLLVAPLVGVSFITLLALEIAGIKWLLLGKVQPGRHRLCGFYYLRKWFVDQTMDLSLDILGPLYASVYLTPWYKLLGARLGRGAEISTASFISPDLLSIGDESFIADSVSLGAPRARDGFMTLGPNQIGKRSFIGNSAMLPPGTVIGDEVLIGCLSAPPANPADALRRDSAWLGSPSIFLPQRQKSAGFSEETTFEPTWKLRVQRAAIEFVRVITPSTCFIILLSLLFSALLLLHDRFNLVTTLLFFPPLYLGCGLAAAGFTVLAKWLLVGHYQPGERPLWSTLVWRNELLNALHEHLATPFLVGSLTGTPFIAWYFRLLGAHIGRRVYMETADFSEFDLVHLGDEAVLNADCTIQTHLFEDRVMKMSTVRLAPRAAVGAGTLVLYDTTMETGASLDALSLLMKGEVLPAHTRWRGIPAQKAAVAT
jgi:carbonic anhydrase/acetyltransferase-like protein (isoleucine patch superfamily)